MKRKIILLKMTTYEKVKLNISDNQKEKIQHAMKNKIPVTIRINEEGNDVLALSKRQINKLQKAFNQNKGVDITLGVKQIKYNMKIEGGFLARLAGMILPALKTIIPAIGDRKSVV